MILSSDVNQALMDRKTSAMNFLNEIVNQYPKAISFAPGRPLEECFNVEQSYKYVETYLAYAKENDLQSSSHSKLGQYGNTKGIIGKLICDLIKNDEKIYASESDIVVTVGSQEAMCLCLLSLAMNSGDVVLVEDPCYIGIMGAAKILGVKLVGVPVDENGLVLGALESIVDRLIKINHRPKILYLSPDFSNPTGTTTSQTRRDDLLQMTKKMGIIILEDHAYNYFNYGENKIGCLKSMGGSEHVIYIGSFSKSIYPGIRIGFLVADQKIEILEGRRARLSDEMSKIKSFITVNSSPINQAIVGGLIIDQEYSLISFTKDRRSTLKRNRDAMVSALNNYFPKGELWCENIHWNIPDGGFFITLTFPFEVTDKQLQSCVNQQGVIWTPMSYFHVEKHISNAIRLSFSYVTEHQISEGIRRLSIFIKELSSWHLAY
jgi:(S)-3,5-dihydroxyphenylglycine transaminase